MADKRSLLPALVALALAGCGASDTPPPPPVDEDSLIACAVNGATQMSRSCAVDRVVEDGTLFLVIRHEDGGFRRFQVATDGSGVMSADGADDALITVFDGEIEVAVGRDRYVLPATVADNGGE